MVIIQAQPAAHEQARSFYHSLIDEMEMAGNAITWVKDVYPSQSFLQASAQRGELFLGMEQGQIAAAMILNHSANPGYEDAPWKVAAREDEVMVIHALGVHPRFGGRGLGAEMARAAIAMARQAGMKAVRLDVLEGNEPARKVYVKCGFVPICWRQMHYENTGLAAFELFEYAL